MKTIKVFGRNKIKTVLGGTGAKWVVEKIIKNKSNLNFISFQLN